MLTAVGLELDAPEAGDIVSVLIRPPAKKRGPTAPSIFGPGLFGREEQAEHENPQHYRVTNLWRVVAVNGGHAVVKAVHGDNVKDPPEMWAIAHHRWFNASELHAALSAVDSEPAP